VLLFAEDAGLVSERGNGFRGLFAAFGRLDGILAVQADTGTRAVTTCVVALTVAFLAVRLLASTAADDRDGDTLDDGPQDFVLLNQHL